MYDQLQCPFLYQTVLSTGNSVKLRDWRLAQNKFSVTVYQTKVTVRERTHGFMWSEQLPQASPDAPAARAPLWWLQRPSRPCREMTLTHAGLRGTTLPLRAQSSTDPLDTRAVKTPTIAPDASLNPTSAQSFGGAGAGKETTSVLWVLRSRSRPLDSDAGQTWPHTAC